METDTVDDVGTSNTDTPTVPPKLTRKILKSRNKNRETNNLLYKLIQVVQDAQIKNGDGNEGDDDDDSISDQEKETTDDIGTKLVKMSMAKIPTPKSTPEQTRGKNRKRCAPTPLSLPFVGIGGAGDDLGVTQSKKVTSFK